MWGAAGVPGQEQSCAARTGVAACQDFVLNNGGSFTEACEYFSSSHSMRSAVSSCHATFCRLGGQERQDVPEQLITSLATLSPPLAFYPPRTSIYVCGFDLGYTGDNTRRTSARAPRSITIYDHLSPPMCTL